MVSRRGPAPRLRPAVAVRTIRSEADLDVARQLFGEYAASLEVELDFQDFSSELASLPGLYAPPAGTLLVAEAEGEVIGCVGLRPLEPPAIAELKRLYVRPAFRGTGAGRALTETALAIARSLGYHRVRLDTLPSMLEARRLYAKLGFREIGPYRYNPVPGTTYMELALSAPR